MFVAALVGLLYSLVDNKHRNHEKLMRLQVVADSVANALDSIYIESSKADSVANSEPKPCIDINNASKSELQSLPRIGPKMADRIIEWRSNQPFLVVDELQRVKGIGPKTFAKLAPLICVDEENEP